MNIKCNVLDRQFFAYQNEYEEAVLRVLRSGWYIMGRELDQFEADFAKKMGVKHCIGLNSGLDALILALRCLDIGDGDEVIVPANTYIATVLAVTENGATPVYVDCDEYHNLDPDKLCAAITSKTKAILPVHLYGQACRMDIISKICKEHGLYLVEDTAQSHGAQFKEQYTGTFGDIGCFSFYPTKPLGALGDSGAVVTDNDLLAERLRMLRNYGSRIKYYNEITGVNSRLDEVQAAALSVGLRHLDENNLERINIARRYFDNIQNPLLELPKVAPNAGHVYHQFPILCSSRDHLQAYLEELGVQTLIHYPVPPYRARCYVGQKFSVENFPNAQRLADQELSLPIYVGLTSEEQDYIITCLNGYHK